MMLTTESPETENTPGEQETFSKRACRSSLRVPWHAVSIALIRQDQTSTFSAAPCSSDLDTRRLANPTPLPTAFALDYSQTKPDLGAHPDTPTLQLPARPSDGNPPESAPYPSRSPAVRPATAPLPPAPRLYPPPAAVALPPPRSPLRLRGASSRIALLP